MQGMKGMPAGCTLWLFTCLCCLLLLIAHVESRLSFSIKRCPTPLDWKKVPDIPTEYGRGFWLSDCSAPAIQQTFVQACYDDVYFRVKYFNVDNNIYNPYTACNDHLYNYDVVELFVAPLPPNGSPVHHYVEIELSPNSVLFASNITNTDLTCAGISGVLIPCSLIKYQAVRNDRDKQWWGELGIPWKLIASNSGLEGGVPTQWAINMFRIDTPLGGQKEYSCWSCDESSPPCFHKPAYFGVMTLE